MTCIPDKITAGTTLALTLAFTAFPAPDWHLTLILRGPMSIDLLSAPFGAQHDLGQTAAVTSGWPPGRYSWALRATRDDEVVQLDQGQLLVAADLASAPDGFDGRSHARRVLEAIEAVLENRASVDQEKYSINNRELWRTPIADLLLLRSRYRDEVRREEQSRNGGQSLLGRQVKVRF